MRVSLAVKITLPENALHYSSDSNTLEMAFKAIYLWDVFQSILAIGISFARARGVRPRIWSDAFSPAMIEGAFKFPLVMRGKIELSATNKFWVPMSWQFGATTAIGSFRAPSLQVPQG